MESKRNLDLQILEEIEKNGNLTQRDVAKKLQIALGLSNAYIRRLIGKGYVMVKTMPRKRLFYNLTPKGIIEKSRLTLLYMSDSLEYYRDIKKKILSTLLSLKASGIETLAILGTGEIAEIVLLMAYHLEMKIDAVIELRPKSATFFGIPVFGMEKLKSINFDAIIVAEDILINHEPLVKIINDHGLNTENMVLFTGHRIRASTELSLSPPSNIPTQVEKGSEL